MISKGGFKINKISANKNKDQSPSKKKGKIRKIVSIVIVSFLVVSIISLMIIPHIIMKDNINHHVNFSKVYEPEGLGLTSDKLSLKTSDNMNIAAYEVYKDHPKAVVIFISGIHNPSVTAFYGHSKMLKNNGYASILLEMRAHGESEGDEIGLGYKEYLDVQAVVDYINKEPKYRDVPIVVFGVSMGGATAINSIGQTPEIDGLISLSAYSSWEDVFCDNMVNMGAPEALVAIQKPFVKLYSTMKYGVSSFNIFPKKQIKNLGARPALIVHSKNDSQVPYQNFERIKENLPDNAETWVREGNFHFIIEWDNFNTPEKDEEYKNRIIGFLDKYFGGEPN
ncbi:alpha/beta hydrolase [Brassicibacter mesophilus]|uniref:alpha/beta hydrolase n=1 Tax=Brassicibacter mesophilus TaxID=745119 RepID=UPI003D221DF3